MIDISPADEIIVNEILKKYVPDCEVRVFGSRHKWTAKSYSDLDLAIVGNAKLDKKTLYALQEAFEESELNFRVDVLDWYAISNEFRAIIEQGYSVIQEKEAENKLPDGWVVKKLGDVINFNPTEKLPKGSVAKKIAMEKLQPYTRKIANYEIANFTGGSKFKNKDTLLARITPCLENGKTSYVDILEDNEIGFGSTEFIVLREKSNITDSKFIYYLSTSPDFRDKAIKSMTGSSGRQRVQTDELMNHEMVIPPLEQQREIAAILSSLDDKIELNQQINKKLEEMAQVIFKEWFIDFNFPDENGNTYRDSGGAMVDSELGQIPVSWSVGKLGDMIETVVDNRGKTPPTTDSGIPLLEVNAIEKDAQYPNWKNIRKFVNTETFDSWFRGHIRQNDILIPTVGTIGNLSLMDDNLACIAQNIVAIRTKDLYSSYYVFYLLKRSKELLLNLNIGGVQPSIKVPHLLNMQIMIPNNSIQMKFDDIVKFLSSKINNQQITNLINIRDTLLLKLMSGEIKI